LWVIFRLIKVMGKGALDKVTLALFSLGIYMIAMLIIGWLSSKRIKNLADYVVAGRRLGLALTFGTLLATWFCTGTAFGGAAMAYLFGSAWGGSVYTTIWHILCQDHEKVKVSNHSRLLQI